MAEGDRSHPPLPKRIGRYEIQGSLGAGAMGAVYKGFDPLIKRTLAIKTIRLDIARGSEEYKTFLERFYQEARISGTLSHPNIVTLFDIGEDNGLPFLALEYIEGETIESLLDRGVKFRPEKVIGLISQIAAALDYAHSKGVIHRDVKPANLLLYEEDRIKISDFGIAKLADSEMTKVGQLLGTPSYMSPEQAMGEKLDGRSDIFSLGVCAFEMLCGQQPFPGNNVTAILYKLVHVGPIEPDNLEMNGLIPQKWHEVFPKVLSKKREDRYQTAADFVRDLEYCLGTWFSGLAPEVATQAMPVPEMPAAPAPRAPALLQRKADDPSVVVSMDEIQDAMGYAGATATPADDDDMPQTIAMRPGEASGRGQRGDSLPPTLDVKPKRGDSLPPTLEVKRPSVPPAAASEDDDLPATIAVQRPSMPPRPPVQEKTVVLPPPTAGSAPTATAPPPAAPATPPAVSKPSSSPPFKPTSKTGALPAYRSTSSLASKSQVPRVPGPGSRPPGPPSRPPAQQLEDLIEEMPEEDAPPMRQGLPVAAVIGGGLALLAVVVVLVVLIAKGRDGTDGAGGTTATTLAAAASGPGTIRVETTPAGASVLIDDQAKGTAPATISGLTTGSHDVVVELKGYDSAGKRVSLSDAQPSAVVTLSLPAAKTAMGEADILSRPAGATVFMDGLKVGQTPLRGFRLRTGTRRFKLTTEGFENQLEFLKVEEGAPARLDARLVPLASAAPPSAPPTPAPSEAASPSAAPAATPTPRPATPKPAPATTLAAAPVTTAAAAPPTTLAAPVRPVVDPTKVYLEDEVDTPPKKLSGNAYQPPRLRSGESVSLTLSWIVSENGEISDIEVVQSGGKQLDEGVVQALRKWKFAPGVKQGVKVKVRLARKYTFKAG